jgi:hypothetical protein
LQRQRLELGHGLGQRQVREIHRDQADGLGDGVRRQGTQVGALQVDYPGVLAESAAQLPVPGIDGIDPASPGFEQGRGEPTGRCADVGHHAVGYRNGPGI